MGQRFLLRIHEDSEISIKSDEDDLGKLRGISSAQSRELIVEIGDLLDAISQSLVQTIDPRGTLTIEVAGSISTTGKVEAGANVYVFNIAGGGEKSQEKAVKLSIEIPLSPIKNT